MTVITATSASDITTKSYMGLADIVKPNQSTMNQPVEPAVKETMGKYRSVRGTR